MTAGVAALWLTLVAPGGPEASAGPRVDAPLRASLLIVERWAEALLDPHPLSPRILGALDDEGVRALCALARDEARPLAVRARAIALLPARPSTLVDATLSALREAPERELRVQAAWSQGARASGQDGSLALLAAMLDDEEPRVREAAIHLLLRLHPREAPALLSEQLSREPDEAVRARLLRRLGAAPGR